MSSSPAPAPVDPNKALRIARNIDYPNEIWYFVACLIALISLFHILSFLWSLGRKAVLLSAGQASNGFSSEGARSPKLTASVSLRRIPLAITSAFRIVVFRCSVALGSNFSTNLAESAIISAYLIAIITWEFIFSKHIIHLFVLRYTNVYMVGHSSEHNGPELGHQLLV